MANNLEIEKMYKGFSHTQRGALLLIALGKKWATELMRFMKKEEVRTLAYWINQMGYVPQEITERVVKDFYDQLMKKSSLSSSGGREYLLSVLGGMMPESEAKELLEQIKERVATEDNEVFHILKRIDPEKLAAYFKHEPPQIVALMLSHLSTSRSTQIIGFLPEQMQTEVIMRIANMNDIDSEVVAAVEEKLISNLNSLVKKDQGEKIVRENGRKEAAAILNCLSKERSKTIMNNIIEKDFDLSTSIKEWMITFEDLKLLDGPAVQKVLSKTNKSELVLAMKGADEETLQIIYANMSKGQRKSIQDELGFMGPIKASVVREAQQKVVATMRELEEEGTITIAGKGGGEDVIV